MLSLKESLLNQKYIAVDIETTGLDWQSDKIIGVAVYGGGFGKYCTTLTEELTFVLQDSGIGKVFHNANFDLKFLERDVEVKGPVIDTLILAQLVDENADSFKLKDLAVRYLGPDSIPAAEALYRWLQQHKLGKESISKAPPELIKPYAIEDVRNTFNLCNVLVQKLKESDVTLRTKLKLEKTPLDYFLEEAMPVEEVLRAMEKRGVRIDLHRIAQVRQDFEIKRDKTVLELNQLCRAQICASEQKLLQERLFRYKTDKGRKNCEAPRFNWDSKIQVGELLYEGLGLKNVVVAKTATGKWKVSSDIIKSALSKNPPQPLLGILDNYAQYLKATKFLSVDIGGLLERVKNGRIFPSFRQIGAGEGEASGTVTGRLSSANPNLQNLPEESDYFYVPDDATKVFLYFDYSQIELRLAALLSNEPLMLQGYTGGVDLHAETARSVFNKTVEVTEEERQIGKAANFLFIYNGSAKRFQQQLQEKSNITISIKEAQDIKNKFFAAYPRYKTYLQEQETTLLRYKAVVSPYGRVRRLPALKYASGINYRERAYIGPDTEKLEQEYHKLPVSKQANYDGSHKSFYDFVAQKVRHTFNQGYNAKIQSFAASLMKRAMIKLHNQGFDIVNQIHDAIIIQVSKDACHEKYKEVKEILETIDKFEIPIVAEGKILNSFSSADKYLKVA